MRRPYADERDVAIQAADAAGRVIRGHTGAVDQSQAREKGLNDLVTRVDEEAQRAIIEVLTRSFPEHEILAEEGTETSDIAPVAEGHRWIIDPLDGTTNFMYEVPPYAVSIALQHEDEIVVGVVLDVPNEELFTAVRGGGVRLNGRPVSVSSTGDLSRTLLATGFPYRSYGHVDAYLDVLGTFMRRSRDLRRHGSAAVDLARVAAGRFGGFFETGLNPWDVAAGILLVEEAGGVVTDYQGAEGRAPVFEHQIVASNGAIHDDMLAVVEQMDEVRA